MGNQNAEVRAELEYVDIDGMHCFLGGRGDGPAPALNLRTLQKIGDLVKAMSEENDRLGYRRENLFAHQGPDVILSRRRINKIEFDYPIDFREGSKKRDGENEPELEEHPNRATIVIRYKNIPFSANPRDISKFREVRYKEELVVGLHA